LLESDLKNMAAELQWQHAEIEYSGHGRIAFTPWHYPKLASSALSRWCSDNVLLIARKTDESDPVRQDPGSMSAAHEEDLSAP
jgi:hypothetical protein